LDRGPLGRYVLPDFGDRIRLMIHIAITPAAYAAIVATAARQRRRRARARREWID
jgi:hypothetical protein